MNICIFCSAYVTDETYVRPAMRLAGLLAENGHDLVWGGSDTGLMHEVADTFQKHGRKLFGVSLLAYKAIARKNADKMVVAENLGDRKALMLEKSDAVIALPGGIGTLDEITEVLELRKQSSHNKPVVILNTDGFYDGLWKQLNRMEKEGFIPVPLDGLIHLADTPEAALNLIGSKTG